MQIKSFKRKIQLALLGISILASMFSVFSCKTDDDSDKLKSVNIICDSTTIGANGQITLTTDVECDGSPALTYDWSLSDETYASISKTDTYSTVLTAENTTTDEKTVTVTVKVSDGTNSKEATKAITIAALDTIDSVTISATLTQIEADETVTLTANPKLATAGDSSAVTYSWEITSGTDYASLSDTTEAEVTLTGKNSLNTDQTVELSVTATYNGKSVTGTCTITVAAAGTVLPTSITLSSNTAALEITDDDSSPAVTLTATLAPTDVTSGYDTITWNSSDTSVATVSEGVVTAVSDGSATITATTVNFLTATCEVTVTGAASSNFIKASDTPTGYASTDWSTSASTAVTVSTKSDLVTYAKKGGYIIYVNGMIDMSEGYLPSEAGGTSDSLDSLVKSKTESAYTTYSEWKEAYAAACSTSTEDGESGSSNSSLYSTLWVLNNAYKAIIQLNIASNTTIIGLTDESGIKGGTLSISGVENVVLRNLTIQDAYDPFPHHEEDDGYNAQFDCITIQGSSTKSIWIDHCTFKDTMELSYVSTGGSTKEKWQTYDGLLDIKGLGKYITVSYCKFMDHDKTSLIGSSDSEGDSSTRLITYHHNYFYNCGQRLPMVRNTTLHLYNNFYSASDPHYTQQYAVGVRKGCIIYAENNYFDSGIKYSFKNSDGTLYSSGNTDKSSSGCNSSVTGSTLFSSAVNAYSYTADSASNVPDLAKANAGAGVWSVKQ